MNIKINQNLNINVSAGTKLRDGLSQNNIFLPSACGGRGMCGLCRLKVLSEAGPLTEAEHKKLSEQEIADNMRLACQITVASDLEVIIPEELISIKEYKATVDSITELTEDIYQFRLRLDAPTEIDFEPGQFIHFCAPKYNDLDAVQRAYSISIDQAEKGFIELIIKRAQNGVCTTYLFDHLAEGDKVVFNGPHGDFRLSKTDAPIIMIAGGSGMAPMKSMLHKIQNEKINRPIKFFFGMNYESELFMPEVIADFERNIPNFEFIPVILNPTETWQGQTGLVTAPVPKLCPDLSDSEAYLCGSPGMLNACIALLTGLKMPKDKIYFDKF